MFYNYSSQEFTYTWGNIPYVFEAGKVYDGIIISKDGTASLLLNEITSRFFAKHLAEHLLNQAYSVNFITNKEGQQVETKGYPMKYNMTTMDMLIERGISPPSIEKPLPAFAAELKIAKVQPIVVAAPPEEPKENLDVVSHLVTDEAEKPKKKAGRPKKVMSPSPEAVFEGV